MKEHIDTATVQADFDRIALLSKQGADEGWNHNNHLFRLLPFITCQWKRSFLG
jgi:hypothetical protein